MRSKDDREACTVSLASYLAHGSTFATSGKQELVGFATVAAHHSRAEVLKVKIPDTGCFSQVDLYKGDVRYDGGVGEGHGPVPVGPDHPVIGKNLIASWHAGKEDCVTKSPSPTPTSSAPASASPSPTPTATPSGSPSSPAPSGTPQPSASSPSDSTAPAVPQTHDSTPPREDGVPPTGSLASTGSSGTAWTAGAAALLLASGGGLVFLQRRRKQAGN
ncbi:LAETG motif-containing sortase-dependent surface protein (plasmid) [Streptomyces sp. AHU1]|uniref:LAETG motif-containing sortase-dependent surface protein n=1 Tax=Streptomyces sp. AHU1 TaxID=3377215 RepID=UPI003877C3AC